MGEASDVKKIRIKEKKESRNKGKEKDRKTGNRTGKQKEDKKVEEDKEAGRG